MNSKCSIPGFNVQMVNPAYQQHINTPLYRPSYVQQTPRNVPIYRNPIIIQPPPYIPATLPGQSQYQLVFSGPPPQYASPQYAPSQYTQLRAVPPPLISNGHTQYSPCTYINEHELRRTDGSLDSRPNKAVSIKDPKTMEVIIIESSLRENAPDFVPQPCTSNMASFDNPCLEDDVETIADMEQDELVHCASKDTVIIDPDEELKGSLSSLDLNDDLENPSTITASILQIPSNLEQQLNDEEVPIKSTFNSQTSLTDSYHDDSRRRNIRRGSRKFNHKNNGTYGNNSRSNMYGKNNSGQYNNQNNLNRYDNFSKHIQKSSSQDLNNNNIDLNNNNMDNDDNNNNNNYETGHNWKISSKHNQKNFQNCQSFNFAQNQKVDQECTVNVAKDLNNNNEENFVEEEKDREKKKEVTFDENNNEIIEDKTAEPLFLSRDSVNETSLNTSLSCKYSPTELNNLRKSPLVLTRPPTFNDNLLDSSLDKVVWKTLFDKDPQDDSNDSQNNSLQNRSNNLKKTNSNHNNNNNNINNSRYDNNHYGQLSRSRSNSEKNLIKVNLSIKENVKLNEAENAWKPSHMQSSNKMSNEERDVEVLSKNFRSLLNKLTEENFDHLIKEINSKKTFVIDTSEKLQAVVELLFEKSISEPGYASTYAKLCRELSTVHVFNVENLSKKSKTRNPWKVFLIGRCQQEFERSKKDDVIFKEITDQIKKATDPEEIENLEDVYFKIRQRANGTVKFIGELYKMNMLTVNIMKSCIGVLISSVTEENIERLCKLLTTVGLKLEDDLKKAGSDEMLSYMRELNRLKNSSVITTLRIKFDIMNVMDLRVSNWKPRENSRSLETKPQKLQDLQEEEEKKKKKQQIQLNEYNERSQNRSHQNMNIGRSKSQRSLENDRYRASSSRDSFDFAKVQIPRKDNSNMTLGPRGYYFQSFSKPLASQMVIPPTTVSNSFAKLSTDCDEPEHLPVVHHTRSSVSNNKNNRRDNNRLKNSQSSYKGSQKTRTPSPEIKPTHLDFEDDEFFMIDLTDKELKDMKILIEKLQQMNKGKITQEMLMTDLKEISITKNVLASVYSDLFDKKSIERKELLEIIADVLKIKLIKNIFNVEALKLALKSIPSIICDVPLAYDYFADYLIFFSENELISIGDIEVVCQNQQNILEKIKQKLSTSSAQQNELSQKRPESFQGGQSENVKEHIASTSAPVKTKCERSLKKVMEKIKFKLEKKQNNNFLEEIYSIIDEENCQDVQNFIQDLTFTLLKACYKPKEKKRISAKKAADLSKLYPVFIRYINGELSSELECINAIQKFVPKSENDSCDMCKIFELFYDNDVISLEAFKLWKNNIPDKQSKALKETANFFLKLEEVDNSDDYSGSNSTVED